MFGIQKFHKYIYGREFTLVTDHKPLTTTLGPNTGVPALAAARLQRWALLLSAYTYNIEFPPTKSHANADGLPLTTLTVANPVPSVSSTFHRCSPPCVIGATAASHTHRPSFVASLPVHTVRLAKTGAQ